VMYRHPWRMILGSLSLFLTTGVFARAVAAPTRPKVVITETRQVNIDPVGPNALRAAIEGALKAQDADVVPESELTEAQSRCADPECFAGLNRTTGATQVLLVDITTANEEDYDFRLRLWEASSGHIADEDRVRCKLCLAADILKIAHDQTGVLWSRYLHAAEARATMAIQSPVPSNPGASPGPLVPTPGDRSAIPPDDGGERFQKRLGWTLIAAGVAVGIVGGAYWIENGHDRMCRTFPDGQNCWTQSDTAKIGIPLVAVGVAAAGAGGVVLYLASRRPSPIALGLTPNGLTAGGRF
jgi:hypothetical protein